MRVRLASERLEITLPPGEDGIFPEQRWIPLVDVEQVVIDAGVNLTMRTLCGLLRREIPILFLAHGRFPSGMAVPLNGFVRCLATQLDGSRDLAFRLVQAKRLVSAKIRNQRRVLQRLAANRKEQAIGSPWLGAMANQAEAAEGLDSLRGLEGAATGRYFEILSAFFPPELPFERRTRRPPLNPANSLLSYLYTILGGELALHLRGCGLEPGWGFYHEAEDGRPSLALDLLEPFRAPVVDALTLDLLNHKILKEEDFDYIEGGYFLQQDSRRKLFAALENRLEREFHYEKEDHRTTIRQIMKNQCLQAKKAFNERVDIQPFIMN